MLYFAYGSNLNPPQMAERCPGHAVVARAVLRDYRLVFPCASSRWVGGVASVEPSAGDVVEGVLFELTAENEAALDRYEGVAEGMYRKTRVEVVDNHGRSHEALTYIAKPQPPGRHDPSPRYMNAIIDGALAHGLSGDYLAALRAIPTHHR